MNLWLASYPRSGNTFVRNVLHHCYATDSAAYDTQIAYKKYADFTNYKVVKTHELIENLPEEFTSLPKVYIIRDGRDAVVSQAFQMVNYKHSALPHYILLIDIIQSKNQTHFGGWSKNVKTWKEFADLVLYYEKIIENPTTEIAQIESLIELPSPDFSLLPTFESQQLQGAKYGNPDNKFPQFFRKGKAGAWKDDMPPFLQDLFWFYHGTEMMANSYHYEKKYINSTDASFNVKNEIIRYLIFGKLIDKKLYAFLLKSNSKRPIYFLLSIYYMSREIIYQLLFRK